MSLPSDTAVHLRRAMELLGRVNGISNAMIVVFSDDGHYQVAGSNDRTQLVRELRRVADHIERDDVRSPS